MKFEWETLISSDPDFSTGGHGTERAKVFGGWVLKHMCWCNEEHVQSESSVFIPDPDHKWELEL